MPIEQLALHVDATDLELEMRSYERPLDVSPFGAPEPVPDWQETHAMNAFALKSTRLGRWTRTDLGVRTFQGLGKNSPAREQVVRRITRDLRTHRLIESLACESHLKVPLHRRCLPDCSCATSATRDIETTFAYRLQPRLIGSPPSLVDYPPSLLPSGGGSTSFSKIDTSVRSMLGTQTLLSMRQFMEDAEKENEKEKGSHDSELEARDSSTPAQKTAAQQDAIKALRMLLDDFEAQVQYQNEIDEESSSVSQEVLEETQAADPLLNFASILTPQAYKDALNPTKEPQLYLCDDWIQPVEVMQKPKELQAKDKARARVAKNCLIVTLMSLNVGYGSLIERYQSANSSTLPVLNSVILTDEEVFTYRDESEVSSDRTQAAPAGMPPSTVLARHLTEVSVNNSEIAVVRDANLEMYHVMSVKQTLREDLAEHSYQFSCRAADWSRSAFCSVPMKFEP